MRPVDDEVREHETDQEDGERRPLFHDRVPALDCGLGQPPFCQRAFDRDVVCARQQHEQDHRGQVQSERAWRRLTAKREQLGQNLVTQTGNKERAF